MISKRIASVAPSVTLGITARAKAMAASGRQVISFGAGEPDSDTPEHIKEAARQALDRGETKYAPVDGIQPLREAIAGKLSRENGLSYRADQIVVGSGAKHSLYCILLAICDDGDDVIIPSPYWLSYPEMVKMAGGRPVFVPCAEASGFKMTPDQLESAVTKRSVAVILNSPCNPTGVVYSGEELGALARVAVRHGLWIISDEIYEKMVYDGATHVSVGSLAPDVFARTITVNGFSKAYAMPGWRLGYMAAPDPVAKAVSALQSHSTSGTTTFAQYGALAALKGTDEAARRMTQSFQQRRDFVHERLSAMNGVTCVRPTGAFYALPNIARLGLGSMAFTERLLESEGVAVVPGLPFGTDACIRISYACSLDSLRQGLDRMARFVATL